MKTKTNCEGFVADIAAFASDAIVFSPEVAAHVQNCAACREKIVELRAAAAMHREAAANLAEPKRRLRRRQLQCALAKGGGSRRDSEIQWRPVLAGAVALALIVGVAVTYRTPRETVDAEHQSKQEQPAAKVQEEAFEPTILALRREVEGGREQMLAATPAGAEMRHYRMKDVQSELRNDRR